MFLCPVGLVLHHYKPGSLSSFIVNFLSTLPVNFLGNFAMTEVGLRVSPLLADWLSITTR
jgi:hypothetical protein